jgi:hypothetical protein
MSYDHQDDHMPQRLSASWPVMCNTIRLKSQVNSVQMKNMSD